MSGMSGISGHGNHMPANCGMQGMHGNEQAKVQNNIEDKISVKSSQQPPTVSDGKGSLLDVKI